MNEMSSALDTDLNVEGWGAGGGDGLQEDEQTASSTQPRDHRLQGSNVTDHDDVWSSDNNRLKQGSPLKTG